MLDSSRIKAVDTTLYRDVEAQNAKRVKFFNAFGQDRRSSTTFVFNERKKERKKERNLICNGQEMEHEMKQRKFIELRDSFKFQDYLILLKSTFVTITDCIMIDFLWLSF